MGRLNIGGQGHCTAVMVHSDRMLVRARCLYNASEGRWWSPSELFYQAGYQNDESLAGSAISEYSIPASYNPKERTTLSSVIKREQEGWAMVKLQEPLGYKTGWMKLRFSDKASEDYAFTAGYRPGFPHALRVSSNCSNPVQFNSGSFPCSRMGTAGALPKFITTFKGLALVLPKAARKNMKSMVRMHNG